MFLEVPVDKGGNKIFEKAFIVHEAVDITTFNSNVEKVAKYGEPESEPIYFPKTLKEELKSLHI